MINIPLKKGIKAVLLSPSPDQRVNILEANTLLEHHTVQIKSISEKYGIGFVDSNRMFKQMVVSGEPIV